MTSWPLGAMKASGIDLVFFATACTGRASNETAYRFPGLRRMTTVALSAAAPAAARARAWRTAASPTARASAASVALATPGNVRCR